MPKIATALRKYESHASLEDLVADLDQQLDGVEANLICAFASPVCPLSQVTEMLSARFPKSTVIGASSAGEFAGTDESKGAISACAVGGDIQVRAGIGINLSKDTEGAVGTALSSSAVLLREYPYRTALILLDPLTGKGQEATLIAAALLGPEVPLAGGAAGDDLAMKSAEVALGPHASNDAVVIAVIHSKQRFGLGVKHGHSPFSQKLTVTRARDATVFEVDGKPAWDVWVEHTAKRAAQLGIDTQSLTEEQVGAFLVRFEAGLPVGSEYKIRAPLSRGADGSLTFACGIPEGNTLYITESDAARQVQSARAAAQSARAALGGAPVAGALVFDCICRDLVLGDEFNNALAAICHELGTERTAGFETYGEIALNTDDMSGFHTTTTVVLAFPE